MPLQKKAAQKWTANKGQRHENGAGDAIRTRDINLGKVALYP